MQLEGEIEDGKELGETWHAKILAPCHALWMACVLAHDGGVSRHLDGRCRRMRDFVRRQVVGASLFPPTGPLGLPLL